MVTNNRTFVHAQAAAWLNQMNAAWTSIQERGLVSRDEFWSEKNPYFAKLTALYEEEFALAKLNDQSDLIVHAEGPGAGSGNPSLGTVNWLSTRMEKRLRALVQAILPMAADEAKAAARDLDLRFTGLAPGSLYMGFAVAELESSMPGMEESDAQTLRTVRRAVQSLPIVPQFVTDTLVEAGIMEALPDPALRDAAIVAAYEMSPTGHKGIHTVEISAPRSGTPTATLGQRERVVLRETALRKPMMGKRVAGSFVGDLRALDLDLGRATLRNVGGGVSSLRCVLKTPGSAHRLLGHTVRVTGEYESSPDGRPRLMRVESIEAHQPQGSL